MRSIVLALALAGCAASPLPSARPWTAGASIGPVLLVSDAFDADGSGPDFGLDRDLAIRQRGALAPARWERLSGVWFDAPPADPEVVRVGDPRAPGLSFHGFSAARLEAPIDAREAGAVIRARVDPVVGDTEGMSWISLTLTDARQTGAWVTGPEMLLGFLVRSNGQVQLFSHEVEIAVAWEAGPPAPADEYRLEVELLPGPRARIRVNEARFEAALGGEIPEVLWLGLGAHYHDGDGTLSRVGAIEVYGSPGRIVLGSRTLPAQ